MIPFGEAFAIIAQIVVCALVAFLGGYWVLSAWFDRRMSAREAVLLGLGLLALMFYSMSMMFAGGPGTLLLAAVVFGTALLLRGLSISSERLIVKSLDADEIARYQEAVEDHPENPHAHSLLADVYRRTGRLELAAEQYQAALDLDPTLREERYWLERMRAEMDRLSDRHMTCPRCATVRRRGELTCSECGRPYSSIETWHHEFASMDHRRQALWLAAALGLGAAAVAVVFFAPGVVKVAGLVGLLLAPVILIVMSARMRRRTG